ncbi:helix-turn-helix domain-containing protein [Hymenobacter algoricola]|uniref:HTH cro/C1-type domain-containing protein n=1 Tax=Hymenobacter algoricola TaxID=486267 RepID=A0ABP7NI72_9BACT
MFSAARIQTIRKSKGYSQELLAEQSGVSLRTIQRVEQGDTVPRGHTVQALAAALGVALEDFRPEPSPVVRTDNSLTPAASPALVLLPVAPALRADPDFVQLLNLSALSFLALPFLNILVPLLLWRGRRHTTADVAAVGRRVLGFQVLWQAGCAAAYLLLALGQLVSNHYFHTVWRSGYVVIFALSYGLNVAVIGHAAWRLRRGEQDVYPVRL